MARNKSAKGFERQRYKQEIKCNLPPKLTCFRCHERSRHREQEKIFFNVDKKNMSLENWGGVCLLTHDMNLK